MAGNRATQQYSKNRDCNSSSRWAYQLKRRPVPRFSGFLHFLSSPAYRSLAAVATTLARSEANKRPRSSTHIIILSTIIINTGRSGFPCRSIVTFFVPHIFRVANDRRPKIQTSSTSSWRKKPQERRRRLEWRSTRVGAGERAYSFVACLRHLTIDRASLTRRSMHG